MSWAAGSAAVTREAEAYETWNFQLREHSSMAERYKLTFSLVHRCTVFTVRYPEMVFSSFIKIESHCFKIECISKS